MKGLVNLCEVWHTVTVVYVRVGGEMRILVVLSTFLIPVIIFYIVGYGLLQKSNVFDSFARGVKGGLETAVQILPTLVGLMVAVGILRASGFLDLASHVLGRVMGDVFPTEVVPLSIVRLFSASAATGLLLDIFKQFGTDSYQGLVAAILMSSTETLVYCMSIYFGSVHIKKTRYTMAGALLATLSGMAASVVMANLMGI